MATTTINKKINNIFQQPIDGTNHSQPTVEFPVLKFKQNNKLKNRLYPPHPNTNCIHLVHAHTFGLPTAVRNQSQVRDGRGGGRVSAHPPRGPVGGERPGGGDPVHRPPGLSFETPSCTFLRRTRPPAYLCVRHTYSGTNDVRYFFLFYFCRLFSIFFLFVSVYRAFRKFLSMRFGWGSLFFRGWCRSSENKSFVVYILLNNFYFQFFLNENVFKMY